MHPFDAWNAVQPFYVQDAAIAYGELVMIKESIMRMNLIKSGKLPQYDLNHDSLEALDLLLRIDALSIILNAIGILLEGEYLMPHQVQLIRDALSSQLSKFK